MTNEELAAIKARHLRDDWWRHSPSMLSPQMHDDRGALLADNERLREAMQNLAERLEVDPSGTDKIDDLEAEIARLREALEDIARGDYSDPMCKLTPEARARAALEGGR